MNYLSVCSGIEAASVAWHPLGWQPFAFAEVDAFPSAVLAHRFPGVPNLGDMTKFREWPDASVSVLVGGTPCQSFSVAGLRAGLADPRGNLALVYLAIAERYRPTWLLWENVPGVLSSNSGRDFGAFLGGLGELGYGFAYRVLDAQHVRVDGFPRAVPQRRRRVFVVGYLGDWRPAAAVLFERESLSGHPAPRREAGAGIAAGTLGGTGPGSGWRIGPEAAAGQLVAEPRWPARVASTLNAHYGDKWGLEDQHINEGGPLFVPSVLYATDGQANAAFSKDCALSLTSHNETPYIASVEPVPFDTTQITSAANRSNPQPGDPCHPLASGAHAPAVAWSIMPQNSGKDFKARQVDVAQPLMAGGPVGGNQGGDFIQHIAPDAPAVAETLTAHWERSKGAKAGNQAGVMNPIVYSSSVRRLTPTECERLQGFPDGWTAIPYRGKPAADGLRYKALGNSMAVNVMRWLGRRIDLVDKALSSIGRAAA